MFVKMFFFDEAYIFPSIDACIQLLFFTGKLLSRSQEWNEKSGCRPSEGEQGRKI